MKTALTLLFMTFVSAEIEVTDAIDEMLGLFPNENYQPIDTTF